MQLLCIFFFSSVLYLYSEYLKYTSKIFVYMRKVKAVPKMKYVYSSLKTERTQISSNQTEEENDIENLTFILEDEK